MSYCMKCGKTVSRRSAWCESCHREVVREMHGREMLPVGGLSCPDDGLFMRRLPEVDPDEPSIRECMEFIHEARRSVRCKGVTVALLEDDGPWQHNAVRAMEGD